MVRESNGNMDHSDLGPDTTFNERCNAEAQLYGKIFDKDNSCLYKLIRFSVTNCGLRYCDKSETGKDVSFA